MLQIGIEIRNIKRTLLALALILALPAFAEADNCDAFATAETLSVPGVWRGFDAAGDTQWLRFAVDSPAVVTLDVSLPLTSLAEPILSVLGRDCGVQDDENVFAYLEYETSRQMLFVRTPGEYLVRVMAEDPSQPLGSYKVTAGFGKEPWQRTIAKATEPMEIDPDDLTSGEPSPDDSRVCAGEEDDHGDTAFCATLLLKREVRGELGNAWGDDTDVFRFAIHQPCVVEIETHSDIDTVGALYNRDGHRLVFDDDGGDGGDFHLVKALVPGSYVVRVEGHNGAEGPYTLDLTTRAW